MESWLKLSLFTLLVSHWASKSSHDLSAIPNPMSSTQSPGPPSRNVAHACRHPSRKRTYLGNGGAASYRIYAHTWSKVFSWRLVIPCLQISYDQAGSGSADRNIPWFFYCSSNRHVATFVQQNCSLDCTRFTGNWLVNAFWGLLRLCGCVQNNRAPHNLFQKLRNVLKASSPPPMVLGFQFSGGLGPLDAIQQNLCNRSVSVLNFYRWWYLSSEKQKFHTSR